MILFITLHNALCVCVCVCVCVCACMCECVWILLYVFIHIINLWFLSLCVVHHKIMYRLLRCWNALSSSVCVCVCVRLCVHMRVCLDKCLCVCVCAHSCALEYIVKNDQVMVMCHCQREKTRVADLVAWQSCIISAFISPWLSRQISVRIIISLLAWW